MHSEFKCPVKRPVANSWLFLDSLMCMDPLCSISMLLKSKSFHYLQWRDYTEFYNRIEWHKYWQVRNNQRFKFKSIGNRADISRKRRDSYSTVANSRIFVDSLICNSKIFYYLLGNSTAFAFSKFPIWCKT